MANYDLTYEGSRVQGILDTGDELRDAGYIFLGEATPSTVPGTPTERVAYIGGPGTYTNFGSSITVGAGCICVFKYTGSAWSNQVINTGLSDAISSEASARQLGDSTLQGGINTVSAAVTAINNAIGNGSVYAGIATPSSTPASGKVFYLAFTAGTYTNFNSLEVPQGINILKNNGSTWLLDSFLGIDDAPTQGSDNLVKSGGVLNSIIQNGPAFDLSAYNAQGGTLATYADLSAALTALNALPADFKKGGMSMKYVQTSDNKYIQYRLMAQNFTTDVTQWQGVDDEPTAGSENFVKSGGVANEINGIKKDIGTIEIILDHTNNGSETYIPCTIVSGKTYKVSLKMIDAGNFWAVSTTTTTLSSVVDNVTERGDYTANQEKSFVFTATGNANYIAVRNGSGVLEHQYKIVIIEEVVFSQSLNKRISAVEEELTNKENTPTENSENLITSGGVYGAIQPINDALDIVEPVKILEVNVTDGTMWQAINLVAGKNYTIKIKTTSTEKLHLLGATAQSLSNITEEFFQKDFVSGVEQTITFTPTANCSYICFLKMNGSPVYNWQATLYESGSNNIETLINDVSKQTHVKATLIPKTLVFTYDANSKSGMLPAYEGYVYVIQYAVTTFFYDANGNKLAPTTIRANSCYLAPEGTIYVEYTGVAGHAGTTFCVGVVPYDEYDDTIWNQYWKKVVPQNGSIDSVEHCDSISNLLAGDSESTAIKNGIDLKIFDAASYGGQRTSFIASNCNKGNIGSNITWINLKDNNVIIIDGTNNPSNWAIEPAYYIEMINKLKSLGAKNIYGLSKFVGKGVNVANIIATDMTYNAQKAFFGDKFIDILGYMASCGIYLNHYFASPFTQPAVGNNVTISVEDVSAFTEVGLFAVNENFFIRYTDANDDNMYDEYKCISIDTANNQIVAQLIMNNGVAVGSTAGKYTASRTTSASSGTYTVNGYIYRQTDADAVANGYLPHYLFTDNIHLGKIALRVVETMLKIRNII